MIRSKGGRSAPSARLGKFVKMALAIATTAGTVTTAAAVGLGGTAGASSRKPDAPLTKVKMAFTAPVTTQLLPQVTQTAGFFKKFGITATITYLTASEAEDELATNGVQMVTFSAPEPEGLRSTGYATQWVATSEDITGLELLGGKGISSVKSLATKPVGETSPGATTAILAQIILKKAGILTKVHFEPLGSVGAMDAAFEAGTIDGVIGASPTATLMLKATPGSSILVAPKKNKGFDWVGAGMAVISTWAASHKQVVTNVIKALIAGDKYMVTPANETAVVKVIETATKATPTEAKGAYGATIPLFKDTKTLVPSLKLETGLIKEYGSVTPKVNNVKPAAVIDTAYAKAAYKTVKSAKKSAKSAKSGKKSAKKSSKSKPSGKKSKK